MAQILYKDIIKNKEINEFIKKGDANLATLGYTEHSKTHCTLVAERAAYLLEKFGHADAEIELAKIAGYMHDLVNHAVTGAALHIRPQKEQIQFSI
jgi:HD superfamily phosphodiesterase